MGFMDGSFPQMKGQVTGINPCIMIFKVLHNSSDVGQVLWDTL